MSTAKERYYEFKGIADKYFEGLSDPIHDYVTELEQEKAELVEFMMYLYVNYHLPYGTMDIDTKKKFEYIKKKYTGG
jgi:hypothetical protein